ncbi:MAG: twin-arginine translocase subunit TatC, partial [Pseudomonadales bacterium]|nr:twin-arginine translocase subunit TatC [Pseudomonadales bacterium]
FAARGGLVLFTLVIAAVIWWWNADIIITWYLSRLSPCHVESCLRVFDPSHWIATRWMLIMLLSVLVTLPVLAWQMVTFSSPGLLPKERIWMSRILCYLPIFAGVAIVLTLLYGLPVIFAWGHEMNISQGLATRYDASELLLIAFTLAWIEGLLVFAICAVLIGGITGLITTHTVGWWRIRVHGFALGLMWLMLPESLSGVRIMVLIISAMCIEASFAPFSSRHGLHMSLQSGRGILDSEGGLRRICIVDCRCAGACPSLAEWKLPSGIGAHSTGGLCLSHEERDELLERARDERFTDVLISGCDSSPLPFPLRDSFSILGTRLSGLNLLKLSSARSQSSPLQTLDLQLALAAIVDPWPESSIRTRQLALLSAAHRPRRILHCETTGKLPWGYQLRPDEVFLPAPGKIGRGIMDYAAESDITVTNIDPAGTD